MSQRIKMICITASTQPVRFAGPWRRECDKSCPKVQWYG